MKQSRRQATSTQPPVNDQRIYGSRPVIPYDSSNQPEVIPNKVYGGKKLPTIRVRLKIQTTTANLLLTKMISILIFTKKWNSCC